MQQAFSRAHGQMAQNLERGVLMLGALGRMMEGALEQNVHLTAEVRPARAGAGSSPPLLIVTVRSSAPCALEDAALEVHLAPPAPARKAAVSRCFAAMKPESNFSCAAEALTKAAIA